MGVMCGHIHTPADKMLGDVHYPQLRRLDRVADGIVEHWDGRYELLEYRASCGIFRSRRTSSTPNATGPTRARRRDAPAPRFEDTRSGSPAADVGLTGAARRARLWDACQPPNESLSPCPAASNSSVAALLLKRQGCDVAGAYMKNWINGTACRPLPWMEDIDDARPGREQIGIAFQVVNLMRDYREKVVQYLLDGYERGLTPNPDIMCNREIKFGVFRAWRWSKASRRWPRGTMRGGASAPRAQSSCSRRRTQQGPDLFPVPPWPGPAARRPLSRRRP